MKFSLSVIAALSTLTEALDDPTIDLGRSLSELADVVRLAVPSAVGLSVRTGPEGSRIELTGGAEDIVPTEIGTSLTITLPWPEAPTQATRTAIVLYARAKGAFVDLAADVTWLAGTRVVDVVLDSHLDPPHDVDPRTTLEAMAAVNQAIGMLLSQGFTPEQAERHIYQRAASTGIAAQFAAVAIMAQLIETGHRGEPNPDS